MSYYLRSLKYLINRWVLRRSHLQAKAPAYGLKITFRTSDYLGRQIYKRGVYEQGLVDLLLRGIPFKAGDVFLDIGANIGWHSLVLHQAGREAVRIFAFEPAPDTLRLLRKNVQDNGAERLTIVPVALAEEEGTRLLHLYPEKNTGRHSLLPLHQGRTVEVRLSTLDHFLEAYDIRPQSVAMMKIDVEGFEWFVLRGGSRLLGVVPYLAMEFSPQLMRQGGVDPNGLLQLLREHAYSPYLIEPGHLQPIAQAAMLDLPPDRDLLWVLQGHDLPLTY